MDKLFVVAIGGTGMRCLESFVHLCAIGMFDNEEIEILTLDTDIAKTEESLSEMLNDLTGDAFDMAAIQQFKTLLGGNENE